MDEAIASEEAVVRPGAVRAKPVVLTGLAAILAALFILGILVPTVLTLAFIPVMYCAFIY